MRNYYYLVHYRLHDILKINEGNKTMNASFVYFLDLGAFWNLSIYHHQKLDMDRSVVPKILFLFLCIEIMRGF